MLSLFERCTPDAPAERTFKTQVDQFWKWYAGIAAQYYQTIEDKRSQDLTDETSSKVDEMGPGFAWEYGPGADEKGHSLTLSGEGVFHQQLLAEYWLTRAPKLAGWTFYSSRQPSSNPGGNKICIGENEFDPKAFWFTPSVDLESECVDLTVWHPLFPELEDRTRWTVLFLFLDEALGEIGTQNWIGKIDMNDSTLASALPLAELPAFVNKVRTEHGWKGGGPREIWSSYQSKADSLDQPRGDIFVGSTIAMRLLNEFGRADGRLEDPLAGTGADYIYVQFDASILPHGKETDKRWEFEEALIAALEPSGSGWHIGGAMGRQFAYIDLIIFDGAASIAIVRDTLKRMKLPSGTSINYFAHEKRGHRLLI